MPTILAADFNGTGSTNWPSTWTREAFITGAHSYGAIASTGETISTNNVSALRTGLAAPYSAAEGGGNLATHFNINGTGGLTTHVETGIRKARFSFDMTAPVSFNGTLNLLVFNTQYGFGLVASDVSSINGQYSLLFAVRAAQSGTSTSALTFVVRGWANSNPQAIASQPTLASQSLGTATAGAAIGTLVVGITIEPTLLRVQAMPSWTPWPAEVTLTVSQINAAMNTTVTSSLLAQPFYPHLNLAYRINGSATPSQHPTLDNFTITNVLAVPLGIVIPPNAALSAHPQAQAQPAGVAESTLLTAATVTTENDGSALTLDVQPSFSVGLADIFATSEHPYDAGYFASHASATRRRRRWQLSWSTLTEAEFTSLFALSGSAEGARKSFLWTDAETGEQVRCMFEEPLKYQRIAQTLYAAEGTAVEVLT